MPVVKNVSYALLLFLFVLTMVVSSVCADDWQPITPEELQMTSEPLAPGAPAIYLYRQVDREDAGSREYHYLRIKILTEEGRKYANIEIPFVKGAGNIRDIRARIVQPNGNITNFDGNIYEKTIVKAKGVKYLAKTFTMPDIQVGNVIEYRYTRELDQNYLFDSKWILSSELFTKHAKFSLKYNNQLYALRWNWPRGLPPGTDPPKDEKHMIRLETRNVPAFQVEDYMPPENEMNFRVEFVYTKNDEKDADKYWKMEGKKLYDGVDAFVGHHKSLEAAVAQIVSPGDSAEVKLQKIYARTQQIRNLTFERKKTEQEQKREKLKDISNVEDVWKRGYGDGSEIALLFLAMVRAAGFEAYSVQISTRDEYFFDPKQMDSQRLNDSVVLIKMDGKDLYFDPGTPFAPYGLLPWHESAVQGLRLDKDGGSWVQTSLPDSSKSQIERKATLNLTDDGSLEGKLTVTFTGLEALSRRLDKTDDDDAARKKYLEDEVRECIPVAAEVELTNKPEWSSSSPVLVAEFDIKVPGWVVGAGRRQLIPVGLFAGNEKHVFEHANRVFPIYFHFPAKTADDITLELPRGWQTYSMPPAKELGGKAINYSLSVENKNGRLHWNRQITIEMLLIQSKYYDSLRQFFQTMKASDEQQIVLSPAGS